MRRPARLLLLAATGCGLLVTSAAADSVSVGDATTLAANKLRVTVTYAYTSAHGARALLLLQVLPLTRAREFAVKPPQVQVSRGVGTRSATFTVEYQGDGATTVSRLAAALAEPGGARPRPFHTQQLAVDWRFPLATQTTPPSTPAETTPAPGGASSAALQQVRAAIRRIRGERQERLSETLRDERLQKLMILKLGVSQDEAANNPPVLEPEPDHHVPRSDDPGVNEGVIVSTDTPDPHAAVQRVSQLTAVNVDAPYRGYYLVNFTYTIGDVTGRTPVSFDCVFDPAVAPWVTQVPWVHTSPDKNYTGTGYVTLWINQVAGPLSLGKAPVTLEARGNGGQLYRTTKWRPKFSWYKVYSTISAANLSAYWASRDAEPVLTSVPINEGTDSIADKFAKYATEPTLLMFKTKQNTYCCGMFMPHRGAAGTEGVWIVDLDCYDAKGEVWTEGYLPADAADRSRSTRSYTNGMLLTRGKGFDLDYHGLDCSSQDADIVVNVDDRGRYILRTLNGCEMRY
jgi:hypothetical protein